MLLFGTAAKRPGLAKEGLLGAWRAEAQFRLCGKASGSTQEYPSPLCTAKRIHGSWEGRMSTLHMKK